MERKPVELSLSRAFVVHRPAPRGARQLVAVALAAVVGIVGGGLSPGQSVPISSKVDPRLVARAHAAPHELIPIIARESDPSSDDAEIVAREVGGRVTHELPIIGAFSARIPGGRLDDLARSPTVAKLWGDGHINMAGDTSLINTQAANTVWKSVIRLTQAQATYSGAGVTVALLDTGVSQTPDLGNRVLARVDLTQDQDGYDHYGHGTHMAGIIAGDGTMSGGTWAGVAPRANVVSVKVAAADGSSDVSVVIAGLQWIVNHRSDYNIRVLNLSFGTDSTQSYLVDPLDYAVEQAWFSGITVVVAAGNRGPEAGTVNKPADDPYVISVGAVDLKNTNDKTDDVVASFSSRGPTQDGFTKPGLVAPGVTIVSNRNAGSTIDQAYPAARVGDSYFKGTGTSQAAAVVSGVAALMYQANPSLSPDMVKALLRQSAFKYIAPQAGSGYGLVDANGAVQGATSTLWNVVPANLGLALSTGLGSIEASRGSLHVYADLPADGQGGSDTDGALDLVQGEIDALGDQWTATGWSATGWSAAAWASVTWTATGWSATGWSATGWSGTSWSASGWASTGWSATAWNGTSWS
jgi:serine protease AprX